MYDIAPDVEAWLADGQDPTVATLVALRGFSSGEPGRSWAWRSDGALTGAPPPGLDARPAGAGLVETVVSDADAVRAGLACGGMASVLVLPASAYPASLWRHLTDRDPVCVVVDPDEGAELFTTATIRDAQPFGNVVPRLFGRGVSTAAIVDDETRRVAVAWWPVPTLVVVGDGLLADALRAQAQLLGWQCEITPEVGAAVDAVSALHASDAVVVLSHDREVDGPVLTAALRAGTGYVGGLGSRRTQQARRDWLTDHGVSESEQARIHGPAGLDIDAHTPAEIAVSIVAEILAARAGSAGGALRDRGGPVHVAGVQAPPPRY